MSKGALSPLPIHLLPLVYVTDGDPGPRRPRLTSTPSDSAVISATTERLAPSHARSPRFSVCVCVCVNSLCEGMNELKAKVNLLT